MTTAAANFAAFTLPARAVPVSAALQIPNTITAATATKIGLGRITSTADPDKYLLSAALTAADLASILNLWGAALTAEESVGIFACADNGSAAGTIGGGADDYVIASIVYAFPLTIGGT